MTETTVTTEQITWEPLPADFELPDEPADNLEHPLLASYLLDILDAAGLLTQSNVVTWNFGICAKVGSNTIVKAPDFVYIPFVEQGFREKRPRSFTPHLEGEVPSVVMEFLSHIDNGEYHAEKDGKWWFYEQILQVPRYVIFEPTFGRLEVYQLEKSGKYSPQIPDSNRRYWIPGVNLFLGLWHGKNQNRTGYWLRWWDKKGNMLLHYSEKIAQLEAKREAAEAKRESDRLKARLRELGIDPNELN